MVYSFYNFKLMTAGASILHTPRSKHENELMKSGDGQPFNMQMITLPSGVNQWDQHPLVNPIDLTGLDSGNDVRYPCTDSAGNLFVYAATDDLIHKCDGISASSLDSDTPVEAGFTLRSISSKGDDVCVVWASAGFVIKWIEYDGLDLNTKNKELTLDSSWSQALFPTIRQTVYDSVRGELIGVTSAWSSSPSPGNKDWGSHWNYSTGNLTPGADLIYKIFDPPKTSNGAMLVSGSYVYIFWNEVLYKRDVADFAADSTIAFTGRTASLGICLDPVGNLCILDGNSLLYLYDGISNILRT